MPTLKPTVRPRFTTGYSCGPTAKFPGWKLDMLKGALVGRSHRAMVARKKIRQAGDELKALMGIPDNYLIGMMSGSDTGAVEAILWNVLGQRPVDVFGWEAFGNDWVTDIVTQLKCPRRAFVGKYGELPPLEKADMSHDVVFTWNGTAAGVAVPNADWISNDREGLTICDATSAIFGMPIPWHKLDVITFSWQKILGGEPQHGMLVLGPRAVERLKTYRPAWPIPKLFRLTDADGRFLSEIFDDLPINTPSLLCIEDLLVNLEIARQMGGQDALIQRSRESYAHLKAWVENTEWIAFLPKVDAVRSNTSPCLVLTDARINALPEAAQRTFCKTMVDVLEAEGVAFDFNGYKDAPPGLRIWCGPTVEPGDVETLTQWLDWAYAQVWAMTFK